MDLEILKSEDVKGEDILNALKYDYDSTIEILENTVIYYDYFDENFHKELYKILKNHNYHNSEANELNRYCPIAYYLSLLNDFESVKVNVVPRFRSIPKFIAQDMFKLEGLSIYVVPIGVHQRLKGVYKKVLDDEFIYKEIITKLVNYSKKIPQVSETIIEFEADTPSKEKCLLKTLKKEKVDIKNCPEYIKDPVALSYYLAKNYNDTINLFSFNRDLEASKRVSNKILDKIAASLAKNKFFNKNNMDENIPSFYMLLAALKNKVISLDVFMQYFKRVEDVNISVDNMDKLMEILKDYKIDDQDKQILLNYGYIKRIGLENKEELERIVKVIKENNISKAFIIDSGIHEDVLLNHNILNEKEVYLLNHSDEYSKNKEKEILKLLNTKYTSLKEYIGNELKDKKISDLDIYNVQALLTYAQKIVDDNKLGCNISFNHCSVRSLGDYNTFNGDINIAIGLNPSVKNLIRTIFHEINHAIQFDNMQNLKLNDDEDVLEYCKEYVLQKVVGKDYYEKNYNYLTYEFDADIKAKIDTAILFNELDDLFVITKDKFEKEYKQLETASLVYIRSFKRSNQSIDRLFYKELSKLKENDKTKYDDLVEYIKDTCPIICYEYDLIDLRKKTIKELLIEMKNASKEERKIYKFIISSRCDIFKVGKEEAIKDYDNLITLAPEYKELEPYLNDININKDKLEKYNEYYDKLTKVIDNKVKNDKKRR